MTRLLPGLLVVIAVTLAATVLAGVIGAWMLQIQGLDSAAAKGNPISPVTVAIVLGLLVASTIAPRPALKPGYELAVKHFLRVGIVLVGIRLSLVDVLQLGAIGIPFVAAIIVSAVLLARWAARRLGVSEKLGLLTAAATSICGVTAALATAPAIEADETEVAYAVANTTLFGMVAMLLYPWLAHAVFAGQSVGAGLFLGTSIHDTSQVLGAALAYQQMFADEIAFKAATVTKLTRNLFIIVVVPLLGWIATRRRPVGSGAPRASLASLVPLFVIGFVAMAVVRTIGDLTLARSGVALGVVDGDAWRAATRWIGEVASGWLLTTAMAAVGLSTRFAMFRRLGARPLWLGGIVAIAVGASGMALALLVSPWVQTCG
ncbi:MAG TPA: putative sulfate exporter family transporter [Thermoanaerobaculia bacterium]|nr:putative sulfate exporter family transporter [Thermoanaerobaculia bacterium]